MRRACGHSWRTFSTMRVAAALLSTQTRMALAWLAPAACRMSARAVAEVDLEAVGLGVADHVGVVVDDGQLGATGQRPLAGDLAHAAEADDQHEIGRASCRERV